MLKVGSVPYWVGRPVDHGLEDEPGIDYVRQVPAELVAGLRDGRLDVALVSSIELFRRPGYGVLDGPVVAGDAEVSSVQVFLEKPLAEIESIALDPASRTAATLSQVAWPGERPRFLEVPPGEDPREVGADGWLRIGDRALEETWSSARAHRTWNPSAAWRELTGLPFVFAAWIVRPGAPIEEHLSAFARAQERGVAALAELSSQAAADTSLPGDKLADYLTRECRYEVGADLTRILRTFRDRAAALRLCDPKAFPHVIAMPPSG